MLSKFIKASDLITSDKAIELLSANVTLKFSNAIKADLFLQNVALSEIMFYKFELICTMCPSVCT